MTAERRLGQPRTTCKKARARRRQQEEKAPFRTQQNARQSLAAVVEMVTGRQTVSSKVDDDLLRGAHGRIGEPLCQ